MPLEMDKDTEEVYTYTIKTENKEAFLVFLGDLHLGHKHFSETYFQKVVYLVQNLAKKHEVVVILMGDLIETDGDYAPGMVEDVNLRLKEQFEVLLQYLKPIGKLCKFAVWGNHEERLLRDSRMKRALEAFGIDDPYAYVLHKLNPEMIIAELNRGLLLEITLGSNVYDLRVAHGAFGGFSQPEMECKRESDNYPLVSLIAMGHHHQRFWKEKIRMGLVKGQRIIYKQYWLGTGTCLRYPPYAEKKSYPINTMGCPIIEIRKDVKHLELKQGPEYEASHIRKAGMMPWGSREKLGLQIKTESHKKYDAEIDSRRR